MVPNLILNSLLDITSDLSAYKIGLIICLSYQEFWELKVISKMKVVLRAE